MTCNVHLQCNMSVVHVFKCNTQNLLTLRPPGSFSPPCGSILQLCVELGGSRILLVEQGPPSLHTHIRLNCSQDDVVFALKEAG